MMFNKINKYPLEEYLGVNMRMLLCEKNKRIPVKRYEKRGNQKRYEVRDNQEKKNQGNMEVYVNLPVMYPS